MRWEEMNAFSPLFRSHEGNQPSRNVQFDADEELLAQLSRTSRMHAALKPYLKKEPKVDGKSFLEDTPVLKVWHRKKAHQLCAMITIDSSLPKEQMSGRLFRLSSEINKLIDNGKF